MEYDKNSNNNNTLKHYLLYYNIIIINDLTIGHINIVIVNIFKTRSKFGGWNDSNPAIKNKEIREMVKVLSFLTY